MAINTIRFAGLASNLDTESIVKSMVTPYKMKADTKKQQQTMMEWRKDAWKEMNSKLFNFYDKHIGKMRLESTFNKSKISVSNPNIIELGKDTTLPTGTHDLEVKNLATGTRVSTEQIKTTDGKTATAATKLKDLGISGDTKIKITANGKPDEITIGENDTISDVVAKLRAAGGSDYNISFDQGMGALFISSKNTGKNQEFSIEGDFAVLNKIGIKTNNEKEVIKDKDGKIVGFITNESTIQGRVIKDREGKIIGHLETGKDPVGANGYDMTDHKSANVIMGEEAKNATIVYNGVESQFESNSISVNGMNMTLKGTTQAGEKVILVSTQDTDASYNVIKEFVDEYNKLIDELNTKIDAPSVREYKPLTDEEKKDMSEKDIEAWEKKIKDSLFRGDESLKTVNDMMRYTIGSVLEVDGEKISLSTIGITTGSWQERGKLYIDEKKLKEALSQDTEKVVKLFAGDGAIKDSKGIGDLLYDKITDITKSTEIRSKYSFYNDKLLSDDIIQAKKDYKDLVSRMERMESMYYKQFTAMEKMMQSLNSQSNWLSQQLGGM